MKFLVVDDEDEVRTTIVQLLQSFGYKDIIEATDGQAGLDLLRSNTVDFIISDWKMPTVNGLEFLQALRSEAATRDIPFIMVTNPGSDEVIKIEHAVGAHVDAYVIKPFRGELLKSKITEVLSKKGGDPSPQGVLVVDDDAQVRAIIVEILEKRGNSPIFQASDGAEALEILGTNVSQIGLVVSDWEMPEVTGINLLKKIRANKSFAQLPFIMVTSQSSIETLKLKDAIDAHVSHYLMKPFTSKDLEEKIQLVLRRADVERKVQRKISDGRKAADAEKFDQAREFYKEAMKLDSRSMLAYLGLAEALLKEAGEGSFDEAVSFIKQAIHIHPKSSEGYLALANAFEGAKSLGRALHILQDANTKVPSDEKILFDLGRLSLQKGQRSQGITYLNEALKIDPEFEAAAKLLKSVAKSKG